MARDYKHEQVHFSTYGKTEQACEQAAENGNQIKRFFGLQVGKIYEYKNNLIK